MENFLLFPLLLLLKAGNADWDLEVELGLETEIWALRLGFKCQGLEGGIWALGLGLGP